jgi:hypothetical protein
MPEQKNNRSILTKSALLLLFFIHQLIAMASRIKSDGLSLRGNKSNWLLARQAIMDL